MILKGWVGIEHCTLNSEVSRHDMNGKGVCVHAVKTRDVMEVSCQFHALPAFAHAESVLYRYK
jgi:hypothetical protein